jgi:glycosyltransferase involved in cell wall biosynthesis
MRIAIVTDAWHPQINGVVTTLTHTQQTLAAWGHAASQFRPRGRNHLAAERPVWMYAGRLAVEKNLEAFLELDLPGTKVLVGDGPDQSSLSQRFPAARFVGYKFKDELAELLSSADVFVFPSRTDTFGLVMLEAAPRSRHSP